MALAANRPEIGAALVPSCPGDCSGGFWHPPGANRGSTQNELWSSACARSSTVDVKTLRGQQRFIHESSHGWRTDERGLFSGAKRGCGAIELSSWTAHGPFLGPLGVRRASSAFCGAAEASEKTLGAASSRLLTVLPCRTERVCGGRPPCAARHARRPRGYPRTWYDASGRCQAV